MEVHYSPFYICCSLKDSVAKNFMKHHLVMTQEMITQCIYAQSGGHPLLSVLLCLLYISLKHKIKLEIYSFFLNGHW